MPELRHDPIQKRWVIIATERGRRPSDFARLEPEQSGGFCPFCEGNEDKTPPEVLVLGRDGRAPNSPGWDIRVVPNKFPALRIEGEIDRIGVGIFDKMNGIGAHEVVIESPHHEINLGDQLVEHFKKIMTVYQVRLKDLMQDLRFRYVLIFKNQGVTAGASLSHPHTQIIATPVTPRTVAMELESARNHYDVKERCLFCDIIRQEMESGERVICEVDGMVAFAPFAARFPFEIFIAPIKHSHDFSEMTEDSLFALARCLKEVLARLKIALNDPPYNFMLHTAPNTKSKTRRLNYWATLPMDFHWHFEIIPRLVRTAGFEWGTGFYINPTPPEDAARYLREIEL
ncbi:galactose-1-phosphate uridylyltransferase [candidate division LCP-89 bacterium B3_LCP]|uniref:Galactose-1-phosphate uridylyltransferase n=1 Tax=candidate division LCP-89 bacterium B3_LCP TaxID=2012998 RepID=A0A532UUY6_UNCL8|nr:MAG: galactose-1-phosphate uridylyltransferase [candidate division LCP-89 bacterium B3_LCP]